jgi:hypothetical protein
MVLSSIVATTPVLCFQDARARGCFASLNGPANQKQIDSIEKEPVPVEEGGGQLQCDAIVTNLADESD